jgi:hypothetical protein
MTAAWLTGDNDAAPGGGSPGAAKTERSPGYSDLGPSGKSAGATATRLMRPLPSA